MSQRTLQFNLSGGLGNADPNASLGGVKSTTQLFGQTLTYSGSPMAGVTLVDAAGVSSGTLHFVKTGNYLGFQKVGGAVPTTAQSVAVAADGTYTLECPETGQYVAVTVVFASLPGADATAGVTAATISQNLFDDVTSAQAEAGAIEYQHFYITNISGAEVQAALFISQQFTGLDYLEIGVKQLTSGWVDELLPDSATAPADIVFFAPDNAIDGLALTIASGGVLGVFVKRTVTALADVGNPSDTAILALAFMA